MIRILHGDCRELLRTLDADSFDSCVTDPPYHLLANKGDNAKRASPDPAQRARVGFMGMKWDGGDVAFRPETWAEVYRVLKPGAFLVAFGGTRTYHRLVCAIEDGGFEVRDMLAWLYGSGFPKSTNKAKIPPEWAGWNTALKPAIEPICLARKPMVGTLAENLQRYGTGALWIDGCRVALDGEVIESGGKGAVPARHQVDRPRDGAPIAQRAADLGRWPANVLHDGSEEVLAAFPITTSVGHTPSARGAGGISTSGHAGQGGIEERRHDTGSAARFFWSPKASRSDRDEGMGLAPEKPLLWSSGEQTPGAFQSPNTKRSAQNNHPTVKPTDLMRYLCKLVTQPGGAIVEPLSSRSWVAAPRSRRPSWKGSPALASSWRPSTSRSPGAASRATRRYSLGCAMRDVTLIDGRVVPSDHMDWRWECLARAVLQLPTIERRREFIAGWEKRHGKKSAERLRELMQQLHAAGEKAGAPAPPQPERDPTLDWA